MVFEYLHKTPLFLIVNFIIRLLSQSRRYARIAHKCARGILRFITVEEDKSGHFWPVWTFTMGKLSMMASETDSPILSKAQLKEQKKAEHERVREITRRKTAQTSWPHHIVFANEKGGTGKSTTAIHVAVALSFLGHKVAIIDPNPRQRTSFRYLENCCNTMARRKVSLACPDFAVFDDEEPEKLERLIKKISKNMDYVLFDTPGRDDKFAHMVTMLADTMVTPINDSFIDLDLIGQVNPENYEYRNIGFYAELIWDLRKKRALEKGGAIDWVVMRNRTQHISARNMFRVEQAMQQLGQRAGFRIAPGLTERVIYRELFPNGLTLLDKKLVQDLVYAQVAARQELRELVNWLCLPRPKAKKIVKNRGDDSTHISDDKKSGIATKQNGIMFTSDKSENNQLDERIFSEKMKRITEDLRRGRKLI